jgi:hypothetical protein
MAKAAVVAGFIHHGAVLTLPVAAATQVPAELGDNTVKIHGVVVVKALTTFKAEPMEEVEEDLDMAGLLHLETDIQELFEYYGELL